MKNVKTVTICLVIAYIILQYAASGRYYKLLFDDDSLSYNYAAIFNLLLIITKGLVNIAVVILGVVTLASGDENIRDKAYSFFRYIYVMGYLIGLPLVVFSMIMNAKYFFADVKTGSTILIQHVFTMTFTVL